MIRTEMTDLLYAFRHLFIYFNIYFYINKQTIVKIFAERFGLIIK